MNKLRARQMLEPDYEQRREKRVMRQRELRAKKKLEREQKMAEFLA
jgi:hypothetical protein